jgi:hypothetical protein
MAKQKRFWLTRDACSMLAVKRDELEALITAGSLTKAFNEDGAPCVTDASLAAYLATKRAANEVTAEQTNP